MLGILEFPTMSSPVLWGISIGNSRALVIEGRSEAISRNSRFSFRNSRFSGG